MKRAKPKKDYVDCKLRGEQGDCVAVLRLSSGGMLEDHLTIGIEDTIYGASSPSVMDDADEWNYIITDWQGNVYAINSINLDFNV